MPTPTSAELLADLYARHNMNGAKIGQLLGIDRSTPSQILRGKKQGANLTGALTELRQRLDKGEQVQQLETKIEKRTTKAGRVAKVRTKTTRKGPSWSATQVKRQAVKGGARSIARQLNQAAENGDRAHVTAVWDKSVEVQSYGKSKRGQAGKGGWVDFEVDPADFDGGDVVAFIIAQQIDRGFISGHGNQASAYASHLLALELRTHVDL